MRLTVLGAGPAYSDREGASGACYLVCEGETNVLLDLGHGSFQRIFGATLPTDLAAVIVSHLHPDHFIDLVPLRHYLRYYLDPPRRLRVLGPGSWRPASTRSMPTRRSPRAPWTRSPSAGRSIGSATSRSGGRGSPTPTTATASACGHPTRPPRASCTAGTAGAPTTCDR